MWPLSITIGVGGRAIVVGTDAAEVVSSLEPWRIDDAGDPSDFCLELAPPAPRPGSPRRLPGLYHGSNALLRGRDPRRLVTALLRVLNGYAGTVGPGQVRLALAPVVRHQVALLAPSRIVAGLPERWLADHSIEAFGTESSLVDATAGNVLIESPLGADGPPTAAAFRGWWLPQQHSNCTLSPGFAVAEAMALAVDITKANAASMLEAVASLVERTPPVITPRSAAGIRDQMLAAFDATPAQ